MAQNELEDNLEDKKQKYKMKQLNKGYTKLETDKCRHIIGITRRNEANRWNAASIHNKRTTEGIGYPGQGFWPSTDFC